LPSFIDFGKPFATRKAIAVDVATPGPRSWPVLLMNEPSRQKLARKVVERLKIAAADIDYPC